jgi:hypothetical protein
LLERFDHIVERDRIHVLEIADDYSQDMQAALFADIR